MENEISAANTYISTTLKGSTVLAGLVSTRLYADVSPEPPAGSTVSIYPLITFNLQSSSDIRSLNAYRGFVTMLYQVKAIGRSGFGELRPIMAEIDALLDRKNQQSITVDGNTYFINSYRDSAVQFSEVESGVIYRHRGNLYRIEVSPG